MSPRTRKSATSLEGQSLELMCKAPMDLGLFLKIAAWAASALAEFHHRGIVHQNVRPQNMSVHPGSGDVQISGFVANSNDAISSVRQRNAPAESSFPYMSPEQTGRINRPVDYRADLYSMGITFYQMLTGRLPFTAHDPLEWVHCHVARTPLPPSTVVPKLPQTVSDVVMKLLAKMPEDRYQSVSGLQFDLQQCSAQWESKRQIAPFILATKDVSERFQISQRLYGREGELDALLQAYERVANSGRPEVVLVSGYSGIGKSSLVHELHKPVVQQRGYFLSGKFEQHKRDIPYMTIAGAFRELVLQLLSESEERIATRRRQLQEALNINSRLIVDIIPPLELILGPQPPVPEVPPSDAQNRLLGTFCNFFGVFTRREHPVVLFLDDLQWMDAGSLDLIEYLITNPSTRYLLLVGAYRDNEVGPGHPLRLSLDTIQKAGARVHSLTLEPLAGEHLEQLFADTLHCDLQRVSPLARLVFEKTQGNPFFVSQFLTTLHREDLLKFDAELRVWTWDIANIEAEGFTDNVVELMIAKLQRLPAATQQALQLAGCLGNAFDPQTLALVSGTVLEETEASLLTAVHEGLLLRGNGVYSFLHDRIQEAAYSLLPAESCAAVHLNIGRLLLTHTSEDTLNEKVFDIVNHLNQGVALVESQEEKNRIAELNLLAGHKAMRATAFPSALQYFSAGQMLLAPDAWASDYELAYGLYIDGARCEWLCGHFDNATDMVRLLMAHARSRLDQVAVYEVKIGLHTTRGEVEDAAQTTLAAGAKLFGLNLSLHPTPEALRETAMQIRRQLGNRSIEELADLPVMADIDMQGAVALLSTSLPSAYFTDFNLHDAMSCEIVRLSLAYGNTEFSPHGYVTFGALLGRLFENWDEAYKFGMLAGNLVEKHALTSSQASTYYTTASFINFWVQHVREVIPLLRKAFQSSLEHGDMNHACYSANLILMCRLIAGDPLAEVAKEAQEQLAFTARAKYEAMHDAVLSINRLVEDLQGKTPIFGSHDAPQFDQNRFEEKLRENVQSTRNLIYYTYKALTSFLAEDYGEAVAASNIAKSFATAFTGQVPMAEYWYVTALALAAHYDQAPPEKQREYSETLIARQEQLRVHQKHGPKNFFNRYALVSAEIARISGRELDAERLYEQAILSARENGFVQNEAIASEVAAKFYRARGFVTSADAYLQQAHSCYARWGADGKVKQLDSRYPELNQSLSRIAATASTDAHQLDALALVKASQAISGQIVLHHLLDTLMRTVLENAGAQKACLILTREQKPTLAAEASVDGEIVNVHVHSQQELAGSVLPLSMLNYVRRSHEKVILADAGAQNPFSEDEYFSRQPSKSVLCLPILKQADLIGLLYLENSLISGAFTPQRLAAVEVVATQAAISLENATLYADLEKEIAERTRAEEDLERFFNMSSDMLCFADFNGYLRRVNPAFERILGFTLEQLLADPFIEFVHPDDRTATQAEYEKLLTGIACMSFENRYRCKDGSYRWMQWSATPLVEKKLIYAVARDITERKRVEEALRRSEDKFAKAFHSSPASMSIASLETGRMIVVNDSFLKLSGFRFDEIIGHTSSELNIWGNPADRDRVIAMLREHGVVRNVETRFRTKTGKTSDALFSAEIVSFGGEECLLAVALDITERKQAEEALREAEQKYRTIVEEAIVGIFQSAPSGQYLSVNPALARMFGYDSPQEFMAGITNIAEQVYVDPKRREEFRRLLERQGAVQNFECQVYRKDGSKMWISANARVIRRDGVVVCYEGMNEDITERKLLEEQLAQSQKMEAIGKLAGGVAHDFNNLLTIIKGYSHMILARARDQELLNSIERIDEAAERAAALTIQLLAFSRQQVLQPKVFNLNTLVLNLDRMLRRLIGEDIEIVTATAPDLGSVKADPSQIEQVIMNLAVNARDAMPAGGKLTLETANVELDETYAREHPSVHPGRYVMLAVSDVGIGMDVETQARVFEPFFTTKETGKGTGLGLSMVYGIVKQSGGNVWVYSEPGRGTTFKVYLPLVDAPALATPKEQPPMASIYGNETILLVEDEPGVRELARTVLTTCGYSVLVAENAFTANSLCEHHAGTIHLLLTDVVMPGLSGRELARQVVARRPGIRVLYMSGYTTNAIVHHGELDVGTFFLPKPFTPESLTSKVRDVLDHAHG